MAFKHSKVTGQPYRDNAKIKVDKSGSNRLFSGASKTAQKLNNGGTYHQKNGKGGEQSRDDLGRFD